MKGQCTKLVNDRGIPKGLKLVLEERGINTDGLIAKAMRDIQGKQEDFKNQTTLIEELFASHLHFCFFFFKFHCELNGFERVWCHAKKNVKGATVRLRTVVPHSLNTCDSELI